MQNYMHDMHNTMMQTAHLQSMQKKIQKKMQKKMQNNMQNMLIFICQYMSYLYVNKYVK